MSHSKLNLANIMKRLLAFIAACVLTMSAANVFAAINTQPTGLSPENSYRLVFVTFGTRDAIDFSHYLFYLE